MNIQTLNVQELYRGEFEDGYSKGLGFKTVNDNKSYAGLFFEGKEHGYGIWKRKLTWRLC